MADFKMTAKELILTFSSSKGSQKKFFKDNHWFKINEFGPEGYAEELASKILACSNLKSDEFVKYERCTIEYNNKLYSGCRSRNFLLPGEQLFSYEKIYFLMTGRVLAEDIIPLSSIRDRIEFVCKIIKEFCNIDVHDSIAKNLTASMVLLETDRHFNNMAIICNKDVTSFRPAPIFDNGASFLSNYSVYPPSITLDDIKNDDIEIVGKPFSASLDYQAHEAGYGIRFDFEKIKGLLSEEKDSRLKSIAEYSINKYSRFPELQISESPNRSIRKALHSSINKSNSSHCNSVHSKNYEKIR